MTQEPDMGYDIVFLQECCEAKLEQQSREHYARWRGSRRITMQRFSTESHMRQPAEKQSP